MYKPNITSLYIHVDKHFKEIVDCVFEKDKCIEIDGMPIINTVAYNKLMELEFPIMLTPLLHSSPVLIWHSLYKAYTPSGELIDDAKITLYRFAINDDGEAYSPIYEEEMK